MRLDDLKKFYSLLNLLEKRLGGARRLSECNGWMSWPKRGIYFFMESGEVRSDSGSGLRIVRVGTHAFKGGARSTLWGRLSQHRGSASGKGNHRGSIFRLLVGTALIERDHMDCPTWDNGHSSEKREIRECEQPIEKVVSKVIGDMPFLWLDVGDEPGPSSERSYIESNSIALLSNYEKECIDPSSSWLGNHCAREKVRKSGLWNQRDVDGAYDPAFLDRMAHHVENIGEVE